jgi:hypothetical protein
MNEKGQPTTEVSLWDPQSKEWSTGPNLPGKGMAGFGASAWDLHDRLIVSNIDGKVFELAADGKEWIDRGESRNARFFHRIIPRDDHSLISFGGANMESGKFTEVEVIELPR